MRPRSSRGASPGRIRSIRDALFAQFAPPRTAVRAPKQRLLVARASNRPGYAPDRAPPRTGLNSGSIEARFEPDFTGTSGVRPVSAREMSPRRVEALKAERISSDDVLKAFTLWGFSDSVHISRALQGRAPGVPVKCPLALLGPRLEPGKLVQIIMSRIMFYYVPIMFIMSGIMSGNFAPNLNQTGWFK